MPIWLAIAFGSVPGVLGLVVAVWRMGALHNEVKTIKEWIAPLPQMASDIAYLKGVSDGRKEAAAQTLAEQLTHNASATRAARSGRIKAV